ncbi:hypothetical protein HY990_04315 [Candidatus Micrarchaeota archaeon]|nr:hypothetical protein [Candidatus Micrarchaeota archaeon]
MTTDPKRDGPRLHVEAQRQPQRGAQERSRRSTASKFSQFLAAGLTITALSIPSRARAQTHHEHEQTTIHNTDNHPAETHQTPELTDNHHTRPIEADHHIIETHQTHDTTHHQGVESGSIHQPEHPDHPISNEVDNGQVHSVAERMYYSSFRGVLLGHTRLDARKEEFEHAIHTRRSWRLIPLGADFGIDYSLLSSTYAESGRTYHQSGHGASLIGAGVFGVIAAGVPIQLTLGGLIGLAQSDSDPELRTGLTSESETLRLAYSIYATAAFVHHEHSALPVVESVGFRTMGDISNWMTYLRIGGQVAAFGPLQWNYSTTLTAVHLGESYGAAGELETSVATRRFTIGAAIRTECEFNDHGHYEALLLEPSAFAAVRFENVAVSARVTYLTIADGESSLFREPSVAGLGRLDFWIR